MTTASNAERSAEAMADRVFEAALGTFDMFAIYVGDRLDYYRLLADHGPLTTHGLAQRAGTRIPIVIPRTSYAGIYQILIA